MTNLASKCVRKSAKCDCEKAPLSQAVVLASSQWLVPHLHAPDRLRHTHRARCSYCRRGRTRTRCSAASQQAHARCPLGARGHLLLWSPVTHTTTRCCSCSRRMLHPTAVCSLATPDSWVGLVRLRLLRGAVHLLLCPSKELRVSAGPLCLVHGHTASRTHTA